MHWRYIEKERSEEPLPSKKIWIYSTKKRKYIGPFEAILDSGADVCFFPKSIIIDTFGKDLQIGRQCLHHGRRTTSYYFQIFKLFDELSQTSKATLDSHFNGNHEYKKVFNLVKNSSRRYVPAHDINYQKAIKFLENNLDQPSKQSFFQLVEVILEDSDEFIIGRNYLNNFNLILNGPSRYATSSL